MARYRNQIIQGVVLTLSALIGVVVLSDTQAMVNQLQGFPLWVFIPVILLKFANYAFRYAQWHYLLGVIGIRVLPDVQTAPPPKHGMPATINLRDNIFIYLAGFPMAISPGKVAELLKAVIVKNLTGVPFTRTAPIVFVERLADGIGVILLTGVVGLIGGAALLDNVEGVSPALLQLTLSVILIGMVTGIFIIQFKPLAFLALKLIAELPLLRRLSDDFLRLYESSYEVLKFRHLARIVSFGIIAYLCDCIGLYLLLRGMGFADSPELLLQACFILGLAVVIAGLSLAPGGAGARELSLAVMFQGIVGASADQAALLTLMISFFQVTIGVLIGIVVIQWQWKRLFPSDSNVAIHPPEIQTVSG